MIYLQDRNLRRLYSFYVLRELHESFGDKENAFGCIMRLNDENRREQKNSFKEDDLNFAKNKETRKCNKFAIMRIY